jgi:hypothetical protein
LRERLLQRFVADRIGQIADVEFVSHGEALKQRERQTMWSFNPA